MPELTHRAAKCGTSSSRPRTSCDTRRSVFRSSGRSTFAWPVPLVRSADANLVGIVQCRRQPGGPLGTTRTARSDVALAVHDRNLRGGTDAGQMRRPRNDPRRDRGGLAQTPKKEAEPVPADRGSRRSSRGATRENVSAASGLSTPTEIGHHAATVGAAP
jgi:hypothetical protein